MIESKEVHDLKFDKADSRDCLMLTKRGDKIIIEVLIDDSGNDWDIPIRIIKEMIK